MVHGDIVRGRRNNRLGGVQPAAPSAGRFSIFREVGSHGVDTVVHIVKLPELTVEPITIALRVLSLLVELEFPSLTGVLG